MIRTFVGLALIIFLIGCSNQPTADYEYWKDKTQNLVFRLNKANIDYIIKEGEDGTQEVWVNKEKFEEVEECCG
ncbi:hypothetical protein ACFO3D_13770 [Virgibacillus kekensis]|uniref:Lipoprotein n=1 Tax=Virgibacillus kekensis TaxID=202261 RepID=A0ABV9DKX1_9BACI